MIFIAYREVNKYTYLGHLTRCLPDVVRYIGTSTCSKQIHNSIAIARQKQQLMQRGVSVAVARIDVLGIQAQSIGEAESTRIACQV